MRLRPAVKDVFAYLFLALMSTLLGKHSTEEKPSGSKPRSFHTKLKGPKTGEVQRYQFARFWRRGKYCPECIRWTIDANKPAAHTLNCSRELVSASGVENGRNLFAPVCCSAARERSRTFGRRKLASDYVPSIPHARAAAPPSGRSLF